MKKMMVALAAVAMGLAAQAATVDWQFTVTASAVDYHAENYTLYLIDGAKWDAAESITADFFTSDAVYGKTTFAAGSGKSATSKTYQTVDDQGAKAPYPLALADSIVAKGGTLDVYYVILDTAKDTPEYYASSATLTGRAPSDSAITTGFGSVANSAVTWTAVENIPEPTSGILLLVGLAGLALKRKVA